MSRSLRFLGKPRGPRSAPTLQRRSTNSSRGIMEEARRSQAAVVTPFAFGSLRGTLRVPCWLDGEPGEAAHVGGVHALDAVRGNLVVGEAREELFERDLRLHPREEGAEAHVAAVAEAEVEVDPAPHI